MEKYKYNVYFLNATKNWRVFWGTPIPYGKRGIENCVDLNGEWGCDTFEEAVNSLWDFWLYKIRQSK